ncbi:ABC-2 transporter permease [Anaerosporobacter sp.]|uniref:ABC-2 transporter permease n=1 Tax=Anaerosporobacter sp. TaxID=1872529 RepID=UPI00286F5388|nr:ABC-2 transporter permease [Anaerosporobacter sp.]
MHSNFLNFIKMQISSLSQILWLQLLSIALFLMFFNQINANNDLANVIIYTMGLLMLSYLIMRNFMFNDEKYKTKLLFGILPVTSNIIIGTRGVIVYLFCLIATPLLVLFSVVTHVIRPEIFAVVQVNILPHGLLLASVFMPIEFLIFQIFEAQKADIIGALVFFPYMGLIALIYKYMMSSSLIFGVIIIAVIANVFVYRISVCLYRNKE